MEIPYDVWAENWANELWCEWHDTGRCYEYEPYGDFVVDCYDEYLNGERESVPPSFK